MEDSWGVLGSHAVREAVQVIGGVICQIGGANIGLKTGE